jgi:hypothetical protein
MSQPSRVEPRQREIEILRVLLDRRLADRAAALADSRWPGSGSLVRLAHEWADLSPEEQRKRLVEIGPEDLARFRELTALSPGIEAVVADLDQRGVLPHLEEAAAASIAAAAVASAAPATAGEGREAPETQAVVPGLDAAPAAAEIAEAEREFDITTLIPPESPNLASVPSPKLAPSRSSGSVFMQAEASRRAQAMTDAEAALGRVRDRLDRSASRVLARPLPGVLPAPPEPVGSLDQRRMTRASRGSAVDPVAQLLRDFAGQVVVQADQLPGSDDELLATANALGLRYAEFVLSPGGSRSVFGGLVRSRGRIETKAGPLPKELAAGSFVVVHGRLYPHFVERLEAGYCDIPGSRATVKLHPGSRVLVVAN